MLIVIWDGCYQERYVNDAAMKKENDQFEKEMIKECRKKGEKDPIFHHVHFYHGGDLVYDTDSGFIYDANRYMRFLYGTLKRMPKPVKTVNPGSTEDIMFFLDLLDPDKHEPCCG